MLPSADPDAICRAAVERQLALAARGRHRLRLPRPEGLMRPGGGRHFHHAPEAFLQISGSTDFDLPYERFRLMPGEVGVLPVRMPHREVHRSDPGEFRQLVFMFDEDCLAWHLKEGTAPGRTQALHLHPTRYLRAPESRRAVTYLADLYAASQSGAAARLRSVQGLYLAYLALLHELMTRSGDHAAGGSHRVLQCRHLVLRSLADPRLSVRGLARRLGCSPNHLSFRFASETGSTLVAHIQRQRMAQAKAMLEGTTITIKEVAVAVGIPDQSYFSRVFRTQAGLSPRQYRERSRPQARSGAGSMGTWA